MSKADRKRLDRIKHHAYESTSVPSDDVLWVFSHLDNGVMAARPRLHASTQSSPKDAARRINGERVSVKRAYKHTLKMLNIFGSGERGTKEILHALAMYGAHIIRVNTAGHSSLGNQLLSWVNEDLLKCLNDKAT